MPDPGPLRLLALIEAYDITGPAKNLLEFASLAGSQGIETTLATFSRGGGDNRFVRAALDRGIPLHVVRESGPFDLRVLAALRRLRDRIQPHILQTHAVKSHFLACLAGWPRRAPWVAFHHGYTWPTLRARAYNHLDRWSLPRAARVLTVSLPFRDELLGRGVPAPKIEVIHNAIRPDWGAVRDAAQIAALRLALAIPAGRRVLLTVGRLSREKDHATLLRAFARLNPPSSNTHLVIVGEGPERAVIEEIIRQSNLSGFVTLTGQQPSAEPYYSLADIVVISSLSEGSPNALLEALAAGVPVVATRVGGIPEIVEHERTALLVAPGQPEPLAQSTARLLADPALASRLAAAGRSEIAGRFSPSARVRRLAAIYRTLARS